MNLTKKIIITDTNIITDLNTAHILEEFVELENVFISDLIKNDEINTNTGDVSIINKFKVVESSPEQLIEMIKLSQKERKLSQYDLLNFIIARDKNYIIATGDKSLKEYSEKQNIEVIRTLKIIELMKEKKVITKEKAIKACNLLKNDMTTRIPKENIDFLLNRFLNDSE